MRPATILTSALLAFLVAAPAVAVSDEVERVDRLKAAYLFNFVKFIEWPASALSDAVTICFVGGKGMHDALASGIEHKRVGARPLIARQLQESASAEGCNVLYREQPAIADSSPASGKDVLPILTVSDAKGFVREGGMIEFFTESNRLRFNINIDNARKAGLQISSSLLQLAAVVEKGE